jgi:hypothetical protein
MVLDTGAAMLGNGEGWPPPGRASQSRVVGDPRLLAVPVPNPHRRVVPVVVGEPPTRRFHHGTSDASGRHGRRGRS